MSRRPLPPPVQGAIRLYASLPPRARLEDIAALLASPEFKASRAGIYVDPLTLARVGTAVLSQCLGALPLDHVAGTGPVCLQFNTPCVDHRRVALTWLDTALGALRPEALLLDAERVSDPDVEFERRLLGMLDELPWHAPHAYVSSPGHDDDYFLRGKGVVHRISRRFGKGVGRRKERFEQQLDLILRQSRDGRYGLTDAIIVELESGTDDGAFLTHCRAHIDKAT